MKKSESPCKKECLYEPRLGFCKSCGRTMEEISKWTKYTDTMRQWVSDEAIGRLEQAKKEGLL